MIKKLAVLIIGVTFVLAGYWGFMIVPNHSNQDIYNNTNNLEYSQTTLDIIKRTGCIDGCNFYQNQLMIYLNDSNQSNSEIETSAYIINVNCRTDCINQFFANYSEVSE